MIAIGELLVFLLLGALVVTPAVLIPVLVWRARRRRRRVDEMDGIDEMDRMDAMDR